MGFHPRLHVKSVILRKPESFRSWEILKVMLGNLGISQEVVLECSIGVHGVYFHWLFLSRARVHAAPNPAYAERDLQVIPQS